MKTYDWNDILIIGDSFAAKRSEETDWPQRLTLTLTDYPYYSKNLPRGQGFQGASWWSVRKELLKQLDINIPKILILCHTDAMRIPSDKDLEANYYTCKFLANKNKHRSPEWNAAVQYFEHLISFDFHKWIQNQWFHELDSILDKYDIPIIIHLYVNTDPTLLYDESMYVFRNGTTINQSLLSYSSNRSNHELLAVLRNHYTTEENILVADKLLNLINNQPTTGLMDL